MSKVKWGVLGCAGFARRRTIPAMLATPSVELVGVASRSAEKAEAFRAEFNLSRAYPSYESLLDDPAIQAIYNPLPNGLHGEWTIRSSEKGKHTLCEKPLTADASEARQVADVARRTGTQVMEGFMWRFHPQHETARRLIDGGAIGTVRLIRAAFSFPLPRGSNVRLVPELAGGSIMDIGCYPISASRFYFGEEPAAVFCRGDIDPEYTVDMRMSGVLLFSRGQALVDCAFDLPYRGSLEIVGESGTIHIPRAWLPEEEADMVVNGESRKLPRANQYVNEFEHFSQCVLNGVPARYGPEDAVLQMRVIDAVRRSVHAKQVQSVES